MVTQKDIAKRLSISTSLVSRALRGTAKDIGASEKTIHRILQEAERLCYVPDAAALSLRGDKSMTIGVVIKDFSDPFFGKMIQELQSLGRDKGFSLLLTGCNGSWDSGIDTHSLFRYRINALIICGSDIPLSMIRPLSKKELPITQIGSGKTYPGINRVEMDEEYGINLLLDHLLSLGHSRIGFIGEDISPLERRKNIVIDMMRKKGVTVNPSWIVSIPHRLDAGAAAMNILLKKAGKNMPTAVIAADDCTAQCGLQSLRNAELNVPDDISITGIDDIPSARLMIPPLTTVRSPINEMVQAAFKLVVDKKAVGGNATVIRLKPELLVRESSSAVKKLKSNI